MKSYSKNNISMDQDERQRECQNKQHANLSSDTKSGNEQYLRAQSMTFHRKNTHRKAGSTNKWSI